MASNKIEIENNDQELKHLGFVRAVAINTLVCLSSLYDYAKQRSGPLKSTVGTVESAVTTVVGPIYQKFKNVPSDLLVFADKKVDKATIKFDEHAPPLAKKVVSQAQSIFHKTTEVAQNLVQEANVGGPNAAIHYAGSLFKDLSVSQSANLWYHINQVRPLHVVAEMALPTATHWSEKYNDTVANMAGKGYTVFNYFPLVPVDDMAKVYKQIEAAKKGEVAEPDMAKAYKHMEPAKTGEVAELETKTD